MDVTEAVISRRSIRGFLPTPVDPALLRRIIETAARAPSGGNLQPWHIDVVGGSDLDLLKQTMATRVLKPERELPEYDIYPQNLPEPYRDHRFQVGEDLYGALGIPRDDKAARLQWFARTSSSSVRLSACSARSRVAWARRSGAISACTSKR